MIARISKASLDTLNKVAEFSFQNDKFLKEMFPNCSTKEEVANNLKKSGHRWSVLITDRPIALFLLHSSDRNATLERFCPESAEAVDDVTSSLVNDLRKMKVQAITMNVTEELIDSLASKGFEKRNALVRFSGRIVETKLMPILPLANPSERDIPALARLMHESYAKSKEMMLPDVSSAEKLLLDIMGGWYGTFLSDSSFLSVASGKMVSACFVTSESPTEANVAQLFTHPLYRARGLATTEIATSMNRLTKRDVSTLTVWPSEGNDVAKRLLSKLGFNQDRKLIQMGMQIRQNL